MAPYGIVPVRVAMLLLAIAALPLARSLSASERSLPKLQSQAAECQRRVSTSPKLRAQRAPWEHCIRALERAADGRTEGSDLPPALLQLGDLFWDLGRHSGMPKDQATARSYYGRYLRTNPATVPARVRTRMPAADRRPRSAAPQPVTRIDNLRHWSYPGFTRLVLDLSHETRFSTETTDSGVVRVVLPATTLAPETQAKINTLAETVQSIRIEPIDGAIAITIRTTDRRAPKILPLSNP